MSFLAAKRPYDANAPPVLNSDGVILHFDYDCFYASVVESENPSLKSLPLAIQQKQIIVTCNYEARRRGLYKLQLITEAKRMCPDVVIVLGEDLTRFRAASRELYSYLASLVWSKKAERLGFDEVWVDVTDMIDFNENLVNHHDPCHSYFHLDKNDPTAGFAYDATELCGHAYPEKLESYDRKSGVVDQTDLDCIKIERRLLLGSHLARYLRDCLEEEKNYTATVGIAVNKILSKLVGNCHKPRSQTTLMPLVRYEAGADDSNVIKFMDDHDIGKIPGIGFKLSQKLREHILGRKAEFSEDLVYGTTKENVTVRNVRLFSEMGPGLLEKILGGPGAQKDIGLKVWKMLHGVDESEVARAKTIPTQISLEDSYKRLDTMEQVTKELHLLSLSLVKRMYLDLTEFSADAAPRQWLAIPRRLRLTTRPRPPPGPDGKRPRSFNRISNSGPMPSFILSKTDSQQTIASRLVTEALIPMFKKLHPEKRGWNLSLINVAATNMHDTANGERGAFGRDIGLMFKRQEEVLKEWNVEDRDIPPDDGLQAGIERSLNSPIIIRGPEKHYSKLSGNPKIDEGASPIIYTDGGGSEDALIATQSTITEDQYWESDDSQSFSYSEACPICNAVMPAFAFEAHSRYHEMEIDRKT